MPQAALTARRQDHQIRLFVLSDSGDFLRNPPQDDTLAHRRQ